jgi:hypothetical protein
MEGELKIVHWNKILQPQVAVKRINHKSDLAESIKNLMESVQ